MAALAALVAGCSDDGGGGAVKPDLAVSLAWVAESGEGLRVVAEPFRDHRDYLADAYPEETMLRDLLHIDSDVSLYRLHLVGPASAVGVAGSIAREGGEDFAVLSPSEGSESPRAKLLRKGVIEGGPAPDASAPGVWRRSFVVGAPGEPMTAETPLEWRRAGVRLPLEPREWTETERRDYIEPLVLDEIDSLDERNP